ncbi:hypothetical protein DFQ27_008632 [Actinomortierella ambigua]|uniref:Uncharacterized protein n=1 Tax=Actinomortierella ambigua TaxID=1343610 RepID=A0A9P6PQ19_9FUNG|nr:hypothetical protein DFQ27_008632 [Actinomortierella ambigua]
MFLRGQIPTTWQMLQRTLDLERQKMNHPIHPHPRGVDAGARGASPAANQGLIRKLEGLLGPFEEMFVALGDAVMREQRRRAESRSSEMLVISVVFILGSTLSTPKEIYRINVGPIQPTPTLSPLSSRPPPSSSSSSSSSPSPNILQPIATTLQTGCTTQEDLLSRKEENEWIRRLAQLMITNGYEYSATTLPRTRAHLVLSAPPGRDEEGLVPRQTLVLPSDQPREEDEKEEGRTCTATRRPLAPPSDPHHLPPPSDSSCMPPPPCPSTFRYPAYTCRISGPTTYVPVSDNEPGTIYTMEATPPASSIWYQAGPSLPIPPNLD